MGRELELLAQRREVLVARSALHRVQLAAHVQDLRDRVRSPMLSTLPALAVAFATGGKVGRVARIAAVALVVLKFAARWWKK